MHVDLYGRNIIVINSKAIEKRDQSIIEMWKPIIIDNEQTNYDISNKGRVRNRNTDKILNQDNTHNSYYRVTIHKKHYSVHRLIAFAFIPIPKKYKEIPIDKLYVNHKDGYKWHNYEYNLEWCTAKENMEHARKHNLNNGIIGENSHLAKMNNITAIKCCILLSEGYNTSAIAALLGISKKSVQHIKDGESWKYLKPHFKFKRIGKAIPYTLSDNDIHKICELLEEKTYSDSYIATLFNVSREYIRDIRNRKRRHNISKDYNF